VKKVRGEMIVQTSNVENQMRLLAQERDELQSKLLMLSNEVERLNGLLNNVREDSEVWRRKYSELEHEMHQTTSQLDYQHRQNQVKRRNLNDASGSNEGST
jgi:chromosome segregation ATPase